MSCPIRACWPPLPWKPKRNHIRQRVSARVSAGENFNSLLVSTDKGNDHEHDDQEGGARRRCVPPRLDGDGGWRGSPPPQAPALILRRAPRLQLLQVEVAVDGQALLEVEVLRVHELVATGVRPARTSVPRYRPAGRSASQPCWGAIFLRFSGRVCSLGASWPMASLLVVPGMPKSTIPPVIPCRARACSCRWSLASRSLHPWPRAMPTTRSSPSSTAPRPSGSPA